MTFEELELMEPLMFYEASSESGPYFPAHISTKGVSLKDFLVECFGNYIPRYFTGNPQGEYERMGKQRSFGDIYRLCKYYYPSTTIEEVRSVLLSFEDLVGHYCPQIKKRVFGLQRFKRDFKAVTYVNKLDEFGNKIEYPNTKPELLVQSAHYT